MKKVVFRFDIDTHKCIRDGVPSLLMLSNKYNIPFTFFINTGRAVSLKESIFNLIKHDEEIHENIEMMSAVQKLGVFDYIYAAIVNPTIFQYKKQVKMLLDSNCEVGIHGGCNHAIWQKCALGWNTDKIKKELLYSINNIKEIKPNYNMGGFASPAWIHPMELDDVLNELGFLYDADFYKWGGDPISNKTQKITLGVNLVGEPGGVAFFENCRVKGYSTDKIVKIVMDFIDEHEITVLYDHPYYAGVKEIETISVLIEKMQKRDDIEICTLEQLI